MEKFFLSVTTLLSVVTFVNAQNSSPYWSLAGNSNAASSSKLGTTNAINLRLYTNNLERARITTSGLFGIGTTNPTDKLHVNSPSGTNAFRAQVNGSTKLLVHSGGGVSIGASTTPPSNGLYVSGNVAIGTTSTNNTYKLKVNNSSTDNDSTAGIYTSGYSYGIRAYATKGPTQPEYGCGVYGSSPNTGVYGSGGEYGTYGSGFWGVYGYSATRTGVFGEGLAEGVVGYSANGFGGSFRSNQSIALYAETNNSDSYAGWFDGAVFAQAGYYAGSDRNIKKKIEDFGNAMSIINKLKPKNYEFRTDGKYASLNLPKGNHYGLIAQELEEVLPNLVKESAVEIRSTKMSGIKPSADGKPAIASQQKEAKESINIKAVNYTELIPIIIKAMQEQQVTIQEQIAENKEQKATIEALTTLVNKLSQNTPSVKVTSTSLGQSTPNPNSTSTTISYNIPGGVTNGELVINNAAGQKVKEIQLNKSGLVDIDTSRLSAGTYFYTLFVNRTAIETKKMVVVRN